jgi:hypothetical protein
MVLGNQVAFYASEGGMMGNPLLAGYLTMAGAALFRRVRQERAVWIVTGHARSARIMMLRDNLGESRGSRRIVAVTERTVSALPRGDGHEFIGRFDMLCRGSVAHLTRNAAVIRSLVQLMNLLVAVDASPVTRVIYLLGGNFVNGIRPVMPVGAEGRGNKEHASHYQGTDGYGKNNDQPYDLSGDFDGVQFCISSKVSKRGPTRQL